MATFTRYKGFRIFGDAMQTYQVLDKDDNVIVESIGLESTINEINRYISTQ